MRTNYKIIKENIKYMLIGYRFKTIFMFLICFNLFGSGYLAYNRHYIDGLLSVLTNSYYVICFMSMILINTINTFDMFEKNSFYIIRFIDRKEYLIQLIRNIIVSNAVLFVINIIVLIIGLNLFVGSRFVVESFMNYLVPNILYVLFYLIRMFFLIQTVATISVLLFKLIDSKIVIIMNIVLWSSFLISPYKLNFRVNSLLDMFWNFCEYFRVHYYSGFGMEVLCSTIYVSALLLLIFALFNFSKNNIKKIGV